jgi:hypothetical protein
LKSQGNISVNAAEIWDLGVKLSEAWFHLADKENQDRYRRSEQLSRSPNGIEIGMRMELQARLESGELIAAGVEAGPRAHSGPMVIGRHFFHDANVDWDTGELVSLGVHFLGLRVMRNPNWRDNCQEGIEPAVAVSRSKEIPTIEQRNPIGRPSVLSEVQETIRELYALTSFERFSSKQIENAVRAAAKIKYPNLFSGANAPARKTINRALEAEGLKGRAAKRE